MTARVSKGALLMAALAGAALVSLLGWRSVSVRGGVELETEGQQLALENSFFDSIFARDQAKHVSARSHKHKAADARAAPEHHQVTEKHKHGISDKQERRLDNDFYDSMENHAVQLASPRKKHLAKVMQARHAAHREQEAKSSTHTHASSNEKAKGSARRDSRRSFSEDFAKAKEALMREKEKMRHLEDKDNEKADLQKTKLERLRAHEQARQYEKHLDAINSKVFPSSMDDLQARQDTTKSVSHALVDDLHAQRASKKLKGEVSARSTRPISSSHQPKSTVG